MVRSSTNGRKERKAGGVMGLEKAGNELAIQQCCKREAESLVGHLMTWEGICICTEVSTCRLASGLPVVCFLFSFGGYYFTLLVLGWYGFALPHLMST